MSNWQPQQTSTSLLKLIWIQMHKFDAQQMKI